MVRPWPSRDQEHGTIFLALFTPSNRRKYFTSYNITKNLRTLDLFSRGYSSGPCPTTTPYDSALYNHQIQLVLNSSPLPWNATHFTLIGYSLGGALAADFASHTSLLPQIRGLVLIAPGGLIRTSHITWKSKFLYSNALLPEWLVHRLVARRLWTGPVANRSIEPEADVSEEVEEKANGEEKGGLRTHAVYASSHLCLLPENPQSTVGNVVDWQIQHHAGFVPAFISSIRHAPIHAQQQRWRILGERLSKGEAGMQKVDIVLGEHDAIIVADELTQDATAVLGKDGINVDVVQGAGHEVPMERPEAVVSVVGRILGL